MSVRGKFGRLAKLVAFVLCAVSIGTFAAPESALASTMTWTLDVSNGCNTGCTTGPFGTVTVTESAANTLFFDVQLSSAYQFMGGAKVFAFNLGGGPTVSFANFNPQYVEGGNVHTSSDDSGFTAGNTVAGNFQISQFGKFMYAIDAGGAGGSNPQGQILQFNVSASGLTLASIVNNINVPAYRFAVELCPTIGCGSGKTGFAGGGPLFAVPVPAGILLLGTGLAGLGFLSRRRQTRPTV